MKKGMLKIGVDKVAQSSYENRVKDKKQSFNALIEHVKQFISTDDIDFTIEDLNREIISKVLDKHSSSFPSILKPEKVLELLDFSVHKCQALVTRYKSIDVEFDTKTKECPNKDFSIYTQNQAQVDEWFNVSSLVDELNKNLNRISKGLIPRNQLSSLIGNVTFYDAVENRFKANIRYILSL